MENYTILKKKNMFLTIMFQMKNKQKMITLKILSMINTILDKSSLVATLKHIFLIVTNNQYQ